MYMLGLGTIFGFRQVKRQTISSTIQRTPHKTTSIIRAKNTTTASPAVIASAPTVSVPEISSMRPTILKNAEPEQLALLQLQLLN